MNTEQLKSRQGPLKQKYRDDPSAAVVTLRAEGHAEGLSCTVATGKAIVEAGLHPATGGDGSLVCSGDRLLEALVACAGVTLRAVATSIGIELRDIRLRFTLDTDAAADQRATLIRLTERYGVVLRTLRQPPLISVV